MSLTPTLASQGNTSAERKQDCGQEEQHAVLKDENRRVMQTGRCPDGRGRDKLTCGDKQCLVWLSPLSTTGSLVLVCIGHTCDSECAMAPRFQLATEEAGEA
nr:uncharacterized protein LOC127320883 isoform X5 [Lolium perenne]XP_051205927.1 uncharacterized protein LOC127320883 isoform X5 [Lolium perenne]XP_051205928.1 uncharacterized protein LOC127320883 isoform X6 [Lolium perenne]